MASFADDVIKNLRVARAGAPDTWSKTFLDTLRKKKTGDAITFKVGKDTFLKGTIDIKDGKRTITFLSDDGKASVSFQENAILSVTKLPFSYRVTGRSRFFAPDDAALTKQLDDLKAAQLATNLSESQAVSISSRFQEWIRQSGLGQWSNKLNRSSNAATRKTVKAVTFNGNANKNLELDATSPAQQKAVIETDPLTVVLTKKDGGLVEASLVDETELATLQYQEKVKRAQEAKRLSPQVIDELNPDRNPNWNKRVALATTIGVSVGVLTGYLLSRNVESAAVQHQKDVNGCYLVNTQTGDLPVKIKLLTCGHYDIAGAMETCATQIYSTANAATITECATNLFNPCARTSKSRASDTSVPLVPNVCDTYLYNQSTPPLSVPGVTVKNACQNPDGSALPATQACSAYCKTDNFNLPSEYEVVCVDIDSSTALVDLLETLGVDVDTVFPPDPPSPPPASHAVSKPLAIAASVLGGVCVLLLAVYMYRRKKNYLRQ